MPAKRRTAKLPARRNSKPTDGSAGILVIGLFKLAKGLALVLIGLGLHRLLHRDVAQTVNHWVQMLRVDPDNRYVHHAISSAIHVSPKQLKEWSAGSFVYAALLLTEGIGLLRRKRWAEYFTVITTGLLIPLEVYELSKHVTAAKAAVLIVNLAVVIYLAVRLKRKL